MSESSDDEEEQEILLSDIREVTQDSTSKAVSKTTAPSARIPPLTSKPHHRAILHVDVDCFYAQSIFVRYYDSGESVDPPPQPAIAVQQKHIVVTCNYPARALGVGKLTKIEDAKALERKGLCKVHDGSDLTDFREDSFTIYETVRRFFREKGEPFQAYKSGMDEYNVDVTELVGGRGDVVLLELANELRRFIFKTTRFSTSVGAGPNIMLAKMAANEKKPYGGYFFSLEEGRNKLKDMPLRALPGLGRASLKLMQDKIRAMNGIKEENTLLVRHLLTSATGVLCGAGLDRADVLKFKECGSGVDRRVVEDDEFKDKKRSGIEQSFRRGTLTEITLVRVEIKTLAQRLLKLIDEENTRFKGGTRVGKNLVVTIRDRGEDGKSSYSVKRKSKSAPWPGNDREKVATAANRLFDVLIEKNYSNEAQFNITLINLAVEWADSTSTKRGVQNIEGFFATKPSPEKRSKYIN
ncbi:hypothetical protein TrLO_g10529 [Triparma laevis f. longispina]|uniref:UmuC domain-containing protein n=1 Tax=Triparma laevis f. longispina TaxID=1714387 RepID=A0A9W7FSW9_9STRA|nr:hypothetical protein TrLO_g10529 [Triparma laevis f. longispina]